jgi:hypothetical protein
MGFIQREHISNALILAVIVIAFLLGGGFGVGVTWAFKPCPTCPVSPAVTIGTSTTTTLEETTSTTESTTTTMSTTTTTGSTLPVLRINPYTGKVLEEDAQKYMEFVMQQLNMTTTTTTLIHRINPAGLYGLYNPDQMSTDHLGQFIVNRSTGMRLRTVDGSNKWSEGNYGYQEFWVERQEARLWLEQMEYDDTIEGVYRVNQDGVYKRLKLSDLEWVFGSSMGG